MRGKEFTNEEKLDAIYQMTLENYEVLRAMRRGLYIAGIIRFFHWAVLIAFFAVFYFYILPFITLVVNNSSVIEQKFMEVNQLKERIPNAGVLDQIIQGLQKGDTNGQ